MPKTIVDSSASTPQVAYGELTALALNEYVPKLSEYHGNATSEINRSSTAPAPQLTVTVRDVVVELMRGAPLAR